MTHSGILCLGFRVSPSSPAEEANDLKSFQRGFKSHLGYANFFLWQTFLNARMARPAVCVQPAKGIWFSRTLGRAILLRLTLVRNVNIMSSSLRVPILRHLKRSDDWSYRQTLLFKKSKTCSSRFCFDVWHNLHPSAGWENCPSYL